MDPTRMPHGPNLAPLMRVVFTLAGLLTVALFWSMIR
jgi:hypothetical protein